MHTIGYLESNHIKLSITSLLNVESNVNTEFIKVILIMSTTTCDICVYLSLTISYRDETKDIHVHFFGRNNATYTKYKTNADVYSYSQAYSSTYGRHSHDVFVCLFYITATTVLANDTLFVGCRPPANSKH